MRRVRPQVELTQESLFNFFSATRLPLLSGLTSALRWVGLVLSVSGFCYGCFALAWWWPIGFWRAELPGALALPAFVMVPGCTLTWWLARRNRIKPAAIALFISIYLISVLVTWGRGVFCTTWYLQPVLALVATCCLGGIAGLTLTLFGVVALLSVPLVSPPQGESHLFVWQHSVSLASVTLASALAGLVAHHLLHSALLLLEMQRSLQQEAQRALRHRERLLRHAMRVETVGDLAGMVTHQLRNAFQVMLGHASLGALGDDADRVRRLALLTDELSNARPLLDQLMSLAHPDDGAPSLRDLDAELRIFHERAARIMPSNITLTLDSCGRELSVQINPRGLEHALWNLVINARHAMPEGGSITLRTAITGEEASLAITDTGGGIAEEIRDLIFDPYFTTKPIGQGTGLGLAAVDRFVRSSNGRIKLNSGVGLGSEFVLTFPLAIPLATAAAKSST